MLPHTYIDADLRNVTPVCEARQRIGIGFDLPNNKAVRVALTLPAAAVMRDVLEGYINSFAGTQSDTSLLIPSEPKSHPSEGENV
ncbi:MAG: hypothetical protein K9K35_10510 [Rhodoferax sp.]|nr:hypothetical protein [Rhodoferax sp.]